MVIQVLIVDDSSFFRKRLAEIINADQNLNVIGMAADGQEAIEQAHKLRPDIITMDLEMPVLDGITAVKHIMANDPTAILMLSSMTTSGAKATLSALEAGAIDYMPKKLGELAKSQHQAQHELCLRLCHLAQGYKLRQIKTKPTNPQPTLASKAQHRYKLVVIGASTGGPVALQAVLSHLPADFALPLLVIQHMPEAFTPSFAERLNSQCDISVKHAEQGDTLAPATAYIAPGGKQLLVKDTAQNYQINIVDSAPDQPYRPCIDTTLNSVAQLCPSQTLVIILTGMGSDGCEGSKNLKRLNASIWSQDEQSSTIYGMPMAIVKANLADKVLNLEQIGQQLSDIKAH